MFAYLDDLSRRREWQLDVKDTKVLTPGPTGVGTEVAETRQVGRRTLTVKWRVTSHEPPRRSTFETYEGSMMKPSGVVTVAPSGEGSLVTFEMDPHPMGIAKLLMPLISRQIRANIANDMAKLKSNLESA